MCKQPCKEQFNITMPAHSRKVIVICWLELGQQYALAIAMIPDKDCSRPNFVHLEDNANLVSPT
jgi:hypothetical protein